ncbi:MAG: ThiF family adenylyltransferase [Pyrinomonadaceae bacterium]
MSQELISRSPDLKRLRDEGHEVGVRGAKLLVSGVPYVNARGDIRRGTLVSELTLAGDVTTRPGTHVINFIGDQPCRKDGSEIESIKHSLGDQDLGDGVVVNRSFSNKPPDGYNNYYDKVTRYIEIISAPAVSMDRKVTARTFEPIESTEEESVFRYLDSNSSRAEIDRISEKLKGEKVAIIGGGGTAAYVMDFVAKTPVSEIHIWDADKFLQHNAFRTPGAASLEDLKAQPSKVAYLAGIYSKMHRHIVIHEEYLEADNLPSFEGFTIVFICVDKGAIKKPLMEYLAGSGIRYIDTGMGIEIVNDSLVGIVRVTSGSPAYPRPIAERGRIAFRDNDDDGVYDSNVQISELNAMNAAMAIVRWKKMIGVYNDVVGEHNTLYTINDNLLHNDDIQD